MHCIEAKNRYKGWINETRNIPNMLVEYFRGMKTQKIYDFIQFKCRFHIHQRNKSRAKAIFSLLFIQATVFYGDLFRTASFSHMHKYHMFELLIRLNNGAKKIQYFFALRSIINICLLLAYVNTAICGYCALCG